MPRARSSFVVDDRQNSPADWAGGSLSRSRFTKAFTGDVEGTSVVEAIMLTVEDGPMAYVGLERLTGSVHGRDGSFLLLHSATALDGAQAASWTVVPGSGTDALAGLSGQGEITGEHDFILDYDLSASPPLPSDSPLIRQTMPTSTNTVNPARRPVTPS